MSKVQGLGGGARVRGRLHVRRRTQENGGTNSGGGMGGDIAKLRCLCHRIAPPLVEIKKTQGQVLFNLK